MRGITVVNLGVTFTPTSSYLGYRSSVVGVFRVRDIEMGISFVAMNIEYPLKLLYVYKCNVLLLSLNNCHMKIILTRS